MAKLRFRANLTLVGSIKLSADVKAYTREAARALIVRRFPAAGIVTLDQLLEWTPAQRVRLKIAELLWNELLDGWGITNDRLKAAARRRIDAELKPLGLTLDTFLKLPAE